jgi:FeS assembly SUF system protein
VVETINETEIKNSIIEVLKTVFDPEIPVNIYDLGLIYEINVFPDANVEIVMTLTSPNCPVAGTLPGEVEEKAKSVAAVKDVTLELIFDPPWSQEMMSEEAKLELGFL